MLVSDHDSRLMSLFRDDRLLGTGKYMDDLRSIVIHNCPRGWRSLNRWKVLAQVGRAIYKLKEFVYSDGENDK